MSRLAFQSRDTWAAGRLYEPFMGRWSRRVAIDFLDGLDTAPDLDWLDVGCGTGGLTETILHNARPRSIRGVEPSAGFLEHAKARIADRRVTFLSGDAQALPVKASRFDSIVSGLVLNFVPEPALAVREMARATRPGGVVAVYVWDYGGRMELLRRFWDAAVELDPSAVELDEGHRFSLCRRGPLAALFRSSGLGDVTVRPVEIPTRFEDFDDYWAPFLGGQGPAPGYANSLSDDRRNALRDRIRTGMPIADDGSIDLKARAWAARGRVPA
jgi:SAM-dependent methyltransferase